MQPWRSRICAIGYRRWSLTCAVSFFFFFSSRRRHTRYIGDWSSDVCSSDLVLIDQHIQSRDAIYVDFFNRPAATTSAVAALALRTGARVVPLFALPLGGGRYRMVYEHPVEPPPEDDDNRIHEFTQRCTDVLEMYVRRHPHLWLWMHRRWRDEGGAAAPERDLYPSVSA